MKSIEPEGKTSRVRMDALAILGHPAPRVVLGSPLSVTAVEFQQARQVFGATICHLDQNMKVAVGGGAEATAGVALLVLIAFPLLRPESNLKHAEILIFRTRF